MLEGALGNETVETSHSSTHKKGLHLLSHVFSLVRHRHNSGHVTAVDSLAQVKIMYISLYFSCLE